MEGFFLSVSGESERITFSEVAVAVPLNVIYFVFADNFVDSISDEQLRMFKNYASIAPSWRKKESIACDLYFPILLALSKEGV